MIDYDFLKLLRGKEDISLIVPEPDKIQRVKERIRIVNEELLFGRPRVKSLKDINLQDLFVEQNKQQGIKKKKERTKIRSLPSVKSSEPCPEGYIRSTRTGKCIKDKKYKLKKAKNVNVDDSILKILKEIKQ